jgi:hypothetical protein
MIILWIEYFCQQKTHNITLLFGVTLLKHRRHFDYRNQPLNTRMRVCNLDRHEAGLKTYYVHYSCFTSICDLFTDSPSYFLNLTKNLQSEREIIVCSLFCSFILLCTKSIVTKLPSDVFSLQEKLIKMAFWIYTYIAPSRTNLVYITSVSDASGAIDNGNSHWAGFCWTLVYNLHAFRCYKR